MRSPGETDLARLLATLQPSLDPRLFVFATLPAGDDRLSALRPVLRFEEQEGTTLILPADAAEAAGLAAIFPCRMITLEVHSSLAAIGLLAAITARLAAAGIPVNAVSAFHHDHLFIPADRAEEAMDVLRQLSAAER